MNNSQQLTAFIFELTKPASPCLQGAHSGAQLATVHIIDDQFTDGSQLLVIYSRDTPLSQKFTTGDHYTDHNSYADSQLVIY